MVRFLTLTTVSLAALLVSSQANAQCQGNVSRQNNLSDVCNASTARTNLGISVGAGEGLTTTLGTFGGSFSGSGTLYPVLQINPQTGVTYTVLNSDCGKMVTYNNASAVAVTLPQAGAASSFLAGCRITHMNIGAGNVTITPTTSTLDGLSSRVLQRYAGVTLTSNGTNYISSGVAPAVGADGLVDPDQLPIATTTTTGAVRAGTCLEMGGSLNRVISITSACRTVAFGFELDGGGSAITTALCTFAADGTYCIRRIPFACTITRVDLYGGGLSGSAVIEVAKYTSYTPGTHPVAGDKITASAPPTISSATQSSDSTLTGWTTAVAAGDWVAISITSISTFKRLSVEFTCVKT